MWSTIEESTSNLIIMRSQTFHRPLICLKLIAVFLLTVMTLNFAQASDIVDSTIEEQITINMRNAELSEVIQWIAEQTGKNIVIDPRVKGKVTVFSNAPMNVTQAYSTFLALLDVYGYSSSESNGILRIFPAAMAKSSPAQLIHDFDNFGEPQGQILYVFTATTVSAAKLSELIKPLIPPSGYIATLKSTNTLIIADEMENVKRLVELMTQLDNSGDLSIEIIKLNHASAKNVAGLVTTLLKTDSSTPFAIGSDDRSNSLLLTGDERTKIKIRRLITQLDRVISDGGNTRVVHLKYMDAAELLPILRNMSSAIIKDSKEVGDSSSAISIEASDSTNAIVMTAPVAILDVMSDVISQVDVRRSQVLVEAIIVEVSQSFSKTIGVEWNSSLSQNDGTEAITNFGLNNVIADAAQASIAGPGLSLGFYRNGSLRALIKAIANETGANILSTPSIVTLDNQEAEVLVGSNIPIISGQATASASTSSPFTTIERKDIGLSLKVTPQVNESNSITLDILQEIETVSQSALVISDIVTDKRSIKTRVLVENQSILVLGGLISSESQQLVSKVPFFGSLPFVGALFRTTTDQIVKKNLMVFIYPSIVDSGEKAHKITKKNYELMNNLRKNYEKGNMEEGNKELKDFIEFVPNKKSL